MDIEERAKRSWPRAKDGFISDSHHLERWCPLQWSASSKPWGSRRRRKSSPSSASRRRASSGRCGGSADGCGAGPWCSTWCRRRFRGRRSERRPWPWRWPGTPPDTRARWEGPTCTPDRRRVPWSPTASLCTALGFETATSSPASPLPNSVRCLKSRERGRGRRRRRYGISMNLGPICEIYSVNFLTRISSIKIKNKTVQTTLT